MWHDMLAFEIPAWEKVIRTIVVYLVILLIFRFAGRSSMAQLSTMDFTVMLLLSNVVQNAIIGPDNSLTGGILGAVVLMTGNSLLDALTYRSPVLRRMLEGRSVKVIENGQPVTARLSKIGITTADLDRAVRLQNGNGIGEVQRGEIDPDGHLAVELAPRYQSATAGDIADLTARLDRIEQLLIGQSRPAPAG